MNSTSLRLLLTLAALAVSFAARAAVITSDTLIGPNDKTYDKQDIVVSNAVLTVDGQHAFNSLRVAAGGALTHSVSASGLLPFLLTITNELHVLTDTNPVTLVRTGIVFDSVMVRDTNRFVIYTNNVDYVLTRTGVSVTLQRTTDSAIPDGDTVSVYYDYQTTIPAGLTLNVTTDVEIEPGASVNADARGFDGGSGTGAGSSAGSPLSGGGGGYGGYGGLSSSNGAGGTAYGSPFNAMMFGSGGGAGVGGPGGAGGGAIRLVAGNNVIVNGAITANGQSATNSRAGGGSGGRIYIHAQTISGGGMVSVTGGAGEPVHGGGGGGGRIQLEAWTNIFTGSRLANGGAGWQRGGAGTVSISVQGTTEATTDNGGFAGAGTPLDSFSSFAMLEIRGRAAVVVPSGNSDLSGLLVRSNSTITSAARNYATLNLTVNGNAVLESGAELSVAGKGYPANQGPGTGSSVAGSGAGHGGYGGSAISSSGIAVPGGNAYDSLSGPTQSGSGGRGGGDFGGGAGGGVVRLTVTGTLQLDGRISADATAGSLIATGGGSGGSVWLTLGGFSGSGVISANGGAGALPGGGGGAGGRIAVTYSSNSFNGALRATGGHGGPPGGTGGAGTIYTRMNSTSVGDLRADNGGLIGTNTPAELNGNFNLTVAGGAVVRPTFSSLSLGTLTVASNSTLLLGNGSSPVNVTVSSNATIMAGGSISGDRLGYPSGGPGGGIYSASGSSGAGHGGYGGRGGFDTRGSSAPGGNAYDGTSNPAQAGSGGGGLSPTSNPGGAGGAGLHLTVNGSLLLDGRISANGGNAISNSTGGGAGGAVWLTLNRFTGTGRISADGGNGHLPNGGGGGGGRIAVYWNSNSFTGTYSAKGGLGFVNGGAGTIYLSRNQSQLPSLLVDNGGLIGTNTVLDIFNLSNLTIRGGARLRPTSASSISLYGLDIATNSTLLAPSGGTLNLTLLYGPVNVAAGGSISADGAGYPSSQGTSGGAGMFSGTGGGGGHGGYGGRGFGNVGFGIPIGGNAYDSLSTPTLSGSGGGGLNFTGGAGGGVIRIEGIRLLAPFTLDGRITANGLNAISNGAGGGAGGTIYLNLNELVGSGTISADGGSGHLPNGGGGGGGRVAANYDYAGKGNGPFTNAFLGTFSAKGGSGYVTGGAGTIYVRTNDSNIAQVLVDNGGPRGTNTMVSGAGSSGGYDVTVSGGAVATSLGTITGQPRNLFVRSNGWLTTSPQTQNSIRVSGNATFDAGGGIDLNGLGSSTLGSGSTFTTPRGGGGHGGYGALNPPGGGNAYDSAIFPTQGGSRGGNGSGSEGFSPRGGAGGGAALLSVGNTLLLNGEFSADGLAGEFNSGGGSGGSLRIETVTLAGSGQITARGGAGNGTAGGGGGGRIAIYYRTNLFAGEVSACGGDGAMAGGAGTIYWWNMNSPLNSLLLDNCNLFGTNTPLSQTFGLATNLTVSGGAVAEMQGTIPAFSNLVVAADSLVTSRRADPNLYLVLLGNLTVAEGGGIAVDGKGFARGSGPGAGGTWDGAGAGGSYGGWGGDSLSGAFSGPDYGSATKPVDRGSGGGVGSGPPANGSEGGGAIRLAVAELLALDGFISADGNYGYQDNSGGGSGGSVWISAKNFTGHGTVSANGGDGEFFGGGGGGGGRLAVYSPTNTFTGSNSAAGGAGAFSGEAGTIFTSGILSDFNVISQTPTGLVPDAVSEVLLEFTEPINPMSVAPTDVRLFTPYGMLSPASLTLAVPAPATLRIAFPTQNVPGDYRLEVGPLIEGLLAARMSQVYTGAFTSVMPLVSGTVTDTNGQPVAGVTLQPDGGLMPATSGVDGNYSIGVPVNWSGTVTPVLGEFVFVPGGRSYPNLSGNVTNQNYQMVASLAPLLRVGGVGTNFFLTWNAFAGATYRVFASTNLVDWLPMDPPIAGTNGLMQLGLPVGEEPQRFFRLTAQN